MFIIVVSGKSKKGKVDACYADAPHRLWQAADGIPCGDELIVALFQVAHVEQAIKHYRDQGYIVHPYMKGLPAQ